MSVLGVDCILSQVAGVLFFLRIADFGLFPSVMTRNGVFIDHQLDIRGDKIYLSD